MVILSRYIFAVIFLVGLCPGSSLAEMTCDWSKCIGGPGSQNQSSVAIDDSGNILIAGIFEGSIDLGGGRLASTGRDDIFIGKYSATGEYIFSKSFGDGDLESISDVAVDATGNIYIAGGFRGTIDLGGGVLTSEGNWDVLLAKFDPNGEHLWSFRFGDDREQYAYRVVIDGAGNAIVTGYFYGTIDFDGETLVSEGYKDIFIAKLDPDGRHLWSARYGGKYTEYAYGLAVDGADNIILTGIFEGTVGFGGEEFINRGGYDIFLAKYTGEGMHIWSRSFYGTFGMWEANAVAADNSGGVVITGKYQGNVDFGGETLRSAGTRDLFIAKFDSLGEHSWSKGFGSSGITMGRNIVVDRSGNVIVTGDFEGTIDFGGGVLTGGGRSDILLLELSANGEHLWSNRFGDSEEQWGWDVATDNSGSIVITGPFRSSVQFGDDILTSESAADIFLVKFSPRQIDLAMDIQPGACPNRVNLKQDENEHPGYGPVLPVHIYGGEYVAGDEIDLTSIKLEGVAPLYIGGGPKVVNLGSPKNAWCVCDRPVGEKDPYPDVRLKFPLREIADAIHPEHRGSSRTLTLTGKLLDGSSFEIRDCILLVGRKSDRPILSDTTDEIPFGLAGPNPFNPVAVISYNLETSSHVHIAIYDVNGGLVEMLVDERIERGSHRIEWNASSSASGVYFCRFSAGEVSKTTKLILLK